MAFGDRVYELRRSRGLTQAQVAERAGLNLRTLQGWESGRNDPGLSWLSCLAQALGVTVDALLSEPEASTGPRPRGRPKPVRADQTPPTNRDDASQGQEATQEKRPQGRPRRAQDTQQATMPKKGRRPKGVTGKGGTTP
jgi:transcriptional regulator with XRE-family HTH domain